jgi:DNA modification methylase
MILQGDCLRVLQGMDDCSVQMCVTSPPYYGLRDYGVEGQIGLESTPEEYVGQLVAVFHEVKRVLKDDGTLWVNIGDSYATHAKGSSGYGTSTIAGEGNSNTSRFREGGKQTANKIGLKDKDLIGIPWMVAFALRADGWYLRSDIIWAKPNPMPESVKDRPTKSHEYIFLLSKSQHYYYDADAVAEQVTQSSIDRINQPTLELQIGSARVPGKTNGNMKAVLKQDQTGNRTYTGFNERYRKGLQEHGQSICGKDKNRENGIPDPEYPTRNLRDVWTITTKPYKEAHFATFPPEIPERCIKAGSKPGDTVLDPFNGSGTTGSVATRLGRNYIGIELNPDYIILSEKRLSQTQLEII